MFENVIEPRVVVQRLPAGGIPLLLQYKIMGQYDPTTNTITITESILKHGRTDEMKQVLVQTPDARRQFTG